MLAAFAWFWLQYSDLTASTLVVIAGALIALPLALQDSAAGPAQDRTIVVTRRVEVEGFGPWTVKSGLLHVAPPFDQLAGMVTLRVHLDPVPETNAPLLIAPGSHRLGQIPEAK